ncbi:MAG TPA: isochorismatase family protein, partial [Polyangiaceae bacterium]|nr:isochorismatase family protein [Polyangiaceae bacterium]
MRRQWQVVKRVVQLGGAALLALSLALAWEIRGLDGVSAPAAASPVGEEIALLVLDVQEEYTGPAALPPFPYPRAGELIARINDIARRSAASKAHVLYVRQVYADPLARLVSTLFLGGRGRSGSAGAELDHRLQLASTDVIEKPAADAFSSA